MDNIFKVPAEDGASYSLVIKNIPVKIITSLHDRIGGDLTQKAASLWVIDNISSDVDYIPVLVAIAEESVPKSQTGLGIGLGGGVAAAIGVTLFGGMGLVGWNYYTTPDRVSVARFTPPTPHETYKSSTSMVHRSLPEPVSFEPILLTAAVSDQEPKTSATVATPSTGTTEYPVNSSSTAQVMKNTAVSSKGTMSGSGVLNSKPVPRSRKIGTTSHGNKAYTTASTSVKKDIDRPKTEVSGSHQLTTEDAFDLKHRQANFVTSATTSLNPPKTRQCHHGANSKGQCNPDPNIALKAKYEADRAWCKKVKTGASGGYTKGCEVFARTHKDWVLLQDLLDNKEQLSIAKSTSGISTTKPLPSSAEDAPVAPPKPATDQTTVTVKSPSCHQQKAEKRPLTPWCQAHFAKVEERAMQVKQERKRRAEVAKRRAVERRKTALAKRKTTPTQTRVPAHTKPVTRTAKTVRPQHQASRRPPAQPTKISFSQPIPPVALTEEDVKTLASVGIRLDSGKALWQIPRGAAKDFIPDGGCTYEDSRYVLPTVNCKTKENGRQYGGGMAPLY